MRADVANLESLSVHANRAETVGWCQPFRQAPLAHTRRVVGDGLLGVTLRKVFYGKASFATIWKRL